KFAFVEVHHIVFLSRIRMKERWPLRSGIDGVLWTIGTQTDRGDEGALRIFSAVNTGFGGVEPAILEFAIAKNDAFLKPAHNLVLSDLRNEGKRILGERMKFAGSKRLAGNDAKVRELL